MCSRLLRTHLLKQTHSCGMQNSPAEKDTFLWNAELTRWNTHSCGMQISPAATHTFLWNAELTCWNTHSCGMQNLPAETHIPVEFRAHLLKQTHFCATHNIPAGLDFAPGTGYVFPTILQKCSPHSRHQLRPNSGALPSGSLVHGSTVLPLPASYVLTDLAPLRVPNQSHRSSNTTKNMCCTIK